jgi:F-box protein 11
MSYTHLDDEHNWQRLTAFREHLCAEVRTQTGEEFFIFQDRKDIAWGQNWRERIDRAISEVTFLIPIITPSFFKSEACRDELKKFLMREREFGRYDLILPLYYVDTPLLNDLSKRVNDEIAQVVAAHQYADWRQLRFEPFTSPIVGKALEKLAIQIRNALERTASTEEPPPHSLDTMDNKVKNTSVDLAGPNLEILDQPVRTNKLRTKDSKSPTASPVEKTRNELKPQNPKSLDSGPSVSRNNFYKKAESEIVRRLN